MYMYRKKHSIQYLQNSVLFAVSVVHCVSWNVSTADKDYSTSSLHLELLHPTDYIQPYPF